MSTFDRGTVDGLHVPVPSGARIPFHALIPNSVGILSSIESYEHALEDKHVVDGTDGDLLDPFGLEGVEVRDVARDHSMAGPGECARYTDLRLHY